MPIYIYQAKNEKGQIVTGTVESENERQATQLLWENKLKVIRLEPRPIVPSFGYFKRVKVSDKAIFARQLSTMVSAGIHLTAALSICLVQSRNKRLKEVLETVKRDVEGGYSLSFSLSKHPDVFDRIFVSVVGAGETTGKLDQVLIALADRLEKDASFKSKIRSALIYPIAVFSLLIIVGTLMITKVIPQLKQIFEESQAKLPLATRAVIAAADFLTKGWWAVILGLVVIFFGLRFYIRSEKGSKWWNNLLISFPIFGDLNKSIIMARFTRIFALLVKSGIPIIDTLHILAEIMDNEIYKKSLYKIADDVSRGIPLSTPLSKDKNFPPIIGQMVGVGEQSGALDQLLDRLGIFYENTVDDKTKNLSALIEPLVIVILGVGVGIMVFAILMPIYQIAQMQ